VASAFIIWLQTQVNKQLPSSQKAKDPALPCFIQRKRKRQFHLCSLAAAPSKEQYTYILAKKKKKQAKAKTQALHTCSTQPTRQL
jgi:hypothetical protein